MGVVLKAEMPRGSENRTEQSEAAASGAWQKHLVLSAKSEVDQFMKSSPEKALHVVAFTRSSLHKEQKAKVAKEPRICRSKTYVYSLPPTITINGFVKMDDSILSEEDWWILHKNMNGFLQEALEFVCGLKPQWNIADVSDRRVTVFHDLMDKFSQHMGRVRFTKLCEYCRKLLDEGSRNMPKHFPWHLFGVYALLFSSEDLKTAGGWQLDRRGRQGHTH